MTTTQVQDRSSSGNWTARLVTDHIVHQFPTPSTALQEVIRAAQDLWALFDEATVEANRAGVLLGNGA